MHLIGYIDRLVIILFVIDNIMKVRNTLLTVDLTHLFLKQSLKKIIVEININPQYLLLTCNLIDKI